MYGLTRDFLFKHSSWGIEIKSICIKLTKTTCVEQALVEYLMSPLPGFNRDEKSTAEVHVKRVDGVTDFFVSLFSNVVETKAMICDHALNEFVLNYIAEESNITKLSLRCFRFCKSPVTPNKNPSTLHREWTITFSWCWFTSTLSSMKWRIFHLLMTIHLRLFNLSCLVFLRTLNWCNQEIKNRKIKEVRRLQNRIPKEAPSIFREVKAIKTNCLVLKATSASVNINPRLIWVHSISI